MTADATADANGITATYSETDAERRLEFERAAGDESATGEADRTAGRRTAVVAQNREGYAMLKVRPTAEGDELERYYGFDMALDHAAELLGVSPHELPVPDAAADMGM